MRVKKKKKVTVIYIFVILIIVITASLCTSLHLSQEKYCTFDFMNPDAQETSMMLNGIRTNIGISKAMPLANNANGETITLYRKIYFTSFILNMEFNIDYTVDLTTFYTTLNSYQHSQVRAIGGTFKITSEGITEKRTSYYNDACIEIKGVYSLLGQPIKTNYNFTITFSSAGELRVNILKN